MPRARKRLVLDLVLELVLEECGRTQAPLDVVFHRSDAELLDLVALGTVADVVSFDNNNRILVAQGVARIRAGRCVPGISALLEVARRERGSLVAADLGFAVAPRLNAAGRLTDMSIGIRCLLCDDPQEARALALELDGLNSERRNIEARMQAEARSAVRSPLWL